MCVCAFVCMCGNNKQRAKDQKCETSGQYGELEIKCNNILITVSFKK